jgi:hypothetical protein
VIGSYKYDNMANVIGANIHLPARFPGFHFSLPFANPDQDVQDPTA